MASLNLNCINRPWTKRRFSLEERIVSLDAHLPLSFHLFHAVLLTCFDFENYFIRRDYPLTFCWLETNRLSAISSAKMGLFMISSELQFRVCNHGKPHASSCTAREEHIYREDRNLGKGFIIKSPWLPTGFSFTESLPGKGSFFFLLGSGFITAGGSSPSYFIVFIYFLHSQFVGLFYTCLGLCFKASVFLSSYYFFLSTNFHLLQLLYLWFSLQQIKSKLVWFSFIKYGKCVWKKNRSCSVCMLKGYKNLLEFPSWHSG